MYKTHTYDDPEQKPSMYEELERNEVFTPRYDEGTYKQINNRTSNKDIQGKDNDSGKIIATDSFKNGFSKVLEIVNASKMLMSYYNEMIKKLNGGDVYFSAVSPGNYKSEGWKASTVNLEDISSYIIKWDTYSAEIKKYNQTYGTNEPVKWSAEEKNAYLWFADILKSIGKNAYRTKADCASGKILYAIVMNKNKPAVDKLSSIAGTMSFMHEIVAHLLNDLNGIDKDGLTEHLEFFGLTEQDRLIDENRQKVFAAYEKSLNEGYSLKNKDIPAGSIAGKILKEIDVTYSIEYEMTFPEIIIVPENDTIK
jgi:hypothetical protein